MTSQQKLQLRLETNFNNLLLTPWDNPREFLFFYMIMKKILNIHNSLGYLVIMEYNGKVNNIIRGV